MFLVLRIEGRDIHRRPDLEGPAVAGFKDELRNDRRIEYSADIMRFVLSNEFAIGALRYGHGVVLKHGALNLLRPWHRQLRHYGCLPFRVVPEGHEVVAVGIDPHARQRVKLVLVFRANDLVVVVRLFFKR
ncbi:hypothetical protein D9M72_370660 [compost metagenome]